MIQEQQMKTKNTNWQDLWKESEKLRMTIQRGNAACALELLLSGKALKDIF